MGFLLWPNPDSTEEQRAGKLSVYIAKVRGYVKCKKNALNQPSRNQTGLRHRKIRNPNIEIRNKFKIQMFKTSKETKDG
jgi:hypothetical protein